MRRKTERGPESNVKGGQRQDLPCYFDDRLSCQDVYENACPSICNNHSDIYAQSLKSTTRPLYNYISHSIRAEPTYWGFSAHHVSRQPLPCLLTSAKCLSSPVRPDLNPIIKNASLDLPPTTKTRVPLVSFARRSISTTKAGTITTHRTGRRKQSTGSRGRSHTSEPRDETVMAGHEVLGRRAGIAENGYAE